jgi:hypothetical protein
VVHRNVRLSEVTVTDILDSYHLQILFHIHLSQSLVLSSLYANDMLTPSRHYDLACYTDDTALVATPRIPSLLVNYLEAYLCRLEHWLRG